MSETHEPKPNQMFDNQQVLAKALAKLDVIAADKEMLTAAITKAVKDGVYADLRKLI